MTDSAPQRLTIDIYSDVRPFSIHTDEEWARAKGFRTTIAQGIVGAGGQNPGEVVRRHQLSVRELEHGGITVRGFPMTLQLLLRERKIVPGSEMVWLQCEGEAAEFLCIVKFVQSEPRHGIEHDGIGIGAVELQRCG